VKAQQQLDQLDLEGGGSLKAEVEVIEQPCLIHG
jgi:hypothetical protein